MWINNCVWNIITSTDNNRQGEKAFGLNNKIWIHFIYMSLNRNKAGAEKIVLTHLIPNVSTFLIEGGAFKDKLL